MLKPEMEKALPSKSHHEEVQGKLTPTQRRRERRRRKKATETSALSSENQHINTKESFSEPSNASALNNQNTQSPRTQSETPIDILSNAPPASKLQSKISNASSEINPANNEDSGNPPVRKKQESESLLGKKEVRYEELAELAALPSPRERRIATSSTELSETISTDIGTSNFAHPAEEEFSHLLDFYGVKWLYEPRSFPLRWNGNRTVVMFTPDFYLPKEDLFIELTTLKQSLVTEKNRKLRHLRELYPDINIKLLYRRDIHRLLAKYEYGPLANEKVQGIENVLFTKTQIQKRISELGRQISNDYKEERPVLIGVLRGAICFISDLMRKIDLPLSVDFVLISTFDGSDTSKVCLINDVQIDLKDRHVLIVEDIVDTGMTVNYLSQQLMLKKPASLKICTLLDKPIRRLIDCRLDYTGFEVPDEFIVGYGMDYLGKYRNLSFVGTLNPARKKSIKNTGQITVG